MLFKKIVILLSLFFVVSIFAADDGSQVKSFSCFDGDDAPFNNKNLKIASKDLEYIDTAEAKASTFHYQREYAYQALIAAESKNNHINLQDLFLIKDCPDLDKNEPTMLQLHACMEVLHDKMEDELGLRFSTIKSWEKKCESLQTIKCKRTMDPLSEDLNEDYEIEENSICQLCAKVMRPILTCRKSS